MEDVKEEFSFLPLPAGSSPSNIANVFIHGYSAGHTLQDRELLQKSIPPSMRDCVKIIAFWPSGHFGRINNISRTMVMTAGRFHPIAGGVSLASDRIIHFARLRARAERMGTILLAKLDSYLLEHFPYITEVNFIGHSLGGRLIISALRGESELSAHSLTIRDVLLMGAAVNIENDEPHKLKAHISGRLINAYSPSDRVLHLNLFENSLGRREVDGFENFNMLGFGHGDYWPHLNQVLVSTKMAGFNGKELGSKDQSTLAAGLSPQDKEIYRVLAGSPPELIQEAERHLQSSVWTQAKKHDADPVLAFMQRLQLLAGNLLVNTVRRRGITYTAILEMLATHYSLSGSELHKCGTTADLEELLMRRFFWHAFSSEHPLAKNPVACAHYMDPADYYTHVNSLAERITVASYFKSPSISLPYHPRIQSDQKQAGPTSFADLQPPAWPLSYYQMSNRLKRAARATSKLTNNVKTAIKPGYSALIPAVAIIFYARCRSKKEPLTKASLKSTATLGTRTVPHRLSIQNNLTHT